MQYLAYGLRRIHADNMVTGRSSVEEAGDQSSAHISCKISRVQTSFDQSAGLAEFVAAREGKCVRDCENKRDDCSSVSLACPPYILPSCNHSPTSVSQINSKRTTATTAKATHSAG